MFEKKIKIKLFFPPAPLCVLQQFCGVLGHTFMEFLKGSGDYCQAQHAAYADEWTAKLAIDPTHLSHRRDPGKLAGPGLLPEPAITRPGWGNSTCCTLPSSASAWPESRWNQPWFFFFFLFFCFIPKERVWVTSPIVRPSRLPTSQICLLLFFLGVCFYFILTLSLANLEEDWRIFFFRSSSKLVGHLFDIPSEFNCLH